MYVCVYAAFVSCEVMSMKKQCLLKIKASFLKGRTSNCVWSHLAKSKRETSAMEKTCGIEWTRSHFKD